MAGSWTPQLAPEGPSGKRPGLQHPGGSSSSDIGKRKQLLFGVAFQSHCQQGPVPFPSASNTIWQKQPDSVKRG